MMRYRARGGFTLVELLLVVAIIGVLAGIIVAATAPAREAARRTQCVEQIRQLVMAVKMYEEDYGFVPIHENRPSERNVQRILLTLHYVTDPRLFICPSDPTRGLFFGTDWDWDGVRMSYAYNIHSSWQKWAFGSTELADHNPLWTCAHHPRGFVIGEYGGRAAYMSGDEMGRRYGTTVPIFEGVTRCMRELLDEYGMEAVHHLSECGGSAPTDDE